MNSTKAICVAAVSVGAVVGCHRCTLAAYAYAGLTYQNLAIYWEDSVADATNLATGPNRDGTGDRLSRDDLDTSIGGGGSGGGVDAAFEDSWVFRGGSSDPQQLCLGDCVHAENDFTRPSSSPIDPTDDQHFARTDGRTTGSILFVPQLGAELVAEIELNRVPSREVSTAHVVSSRNSLLRLLQPDELVFDFDADIFLRAMNSSLAPHTKLEAFSELHIILRTGSNVIFDFSPNGDLANSNAGTVVADPFALDATALTKSPFPLADNQHSAVGQFRAISPTLVPGVTYVLEFTQEVRVTATNVPEPGAFCLLMLGCLLASPRRRW